MQDAFTEAEACVRSSGYIVLGRLTYASSYEGTKDTVRRALAQHEARTGERNAFRYNTPIIFAPVPQEV